jgi:chorismate synthase
VGGVIEVIATGFPAGVGEPPFDSLESSLAQAVFGVPGVKALEFGLGLGFATAKGSTANDPIGLVDGQPRPLGNNSGGINGGISNGNPILFAATFRPTASISLPQKSVRLSTLKEETIVVKGRHDPCILPRAVPVLEAVTALVLLDSLLEAEGKAWLS